MTGLLMFAGNMGGLLAAAPLALVVAYTSWRYVLYPLTLLMLMLIRPQGLLGTAEWGFLKAPFVKARARSESTAAASLPQVENQQGAK
jgi:hypothetical protein